MLFPRSTHIWAMEQEGPRQPLPGEVRFAFYLGVIGGVLNHAGRAALARAYCTESIQTSGNSLLIEYVSGSRTRMSWWRRSHVRFRAPGNPGREARPRALPWT